MWGSFGSNHKMPKKKTQTEPVVIKVEISIRNSDGTQTTKILTGKDAQLWHEYCIGVSQLAQAHDANPPFGQLKWKTHTTKK